MVDRIHLTPIRTNNLMSVSAFGFLADFRTHLEKSSLSLCDYVNITFNFIKKRLKLHDWEITYDKNPRPASLLGQGPIRPRDGPVLIYHRKYIHYTNNVIFNLRNCGTCTFYYDAIPKHIIEEAYIIRIALERLFPKLFFFNKSPNIVQFPYFMLRHPTQ
jgi:hypothetical protein